MSACRNTAHEVERPTAVQRLIYPGNVAYILGTSDGTGSHPCLSLPGFWGAFFVSGSIVFRRHSESKHFRQRG